MTTEDRIERVREIEAIVAEAAKQGWSLDGILYKDEAGEDFSVEIHMRFDGSEIDTIL